MAKKKPMFEDYGDAPKVIDGRPFYNFDLDEEKADDLIASGKASMDGDAIVIDVTELGYDKVLAKGKISKTFKISAPKFSASAIEKIEEVGGEAIEL